MKTFLHRKLNSERDGSLRRLRSIALSRSSEDNFYSIGWMGDLQSESLAVARFCGVWGKELDPAGDFIAFPAASGRRFRIAAAIGDPGYSHYLPERLPRSAVARPWERSRCNHWCIPQRRSAGGDYAPSG